LTGGFLQTAPEHKVRGNLRLCGEYAGVSVPVAGRVSQNEKTPADARAFRIETSRGRLLERGLDAGEGRIQLRAEALHDRDDCDRDAGCDEAIFDGGRTRLVLHKALNQVRHV